MRKFFAAILSIICLTCLAVAAACAGDGEPNYFTLTYDAIDGVTLDFGEIQNGAKVREGYIVRFKCDIDESVVMGEPVILVNDEDQYPDLEGVYSFTMTEDTYVTVSGVYTISAYDVIFDAGDWRLSYTDKDGNELNEVKGVNFGETVEFKLKLSVYYDKQSKFSVLANTQIISPDENGVYSVNVIRDTTVSVTGLELEKSFIERENGGAGTESDPYIIERPIDLYVLASGVNNPFNASGIYALASYKLVNDIDMEGEQLFIIGDTTCATAMFMGEFDGNGHTIRNYYISDRIIEQEGFTEQFMNYIGLFGQVVATAYGPAYIHGLTLENFEIRIDAARYATGFYAGSLVGMAIGVDIVNCSAVNGKITADADTNYFGYMGGIIGYLRSAYADTLSYNSSIVGCYSNVTVGGESGYIRAGGGLAGYLDSSDEYANAYVLNSYYTGEVYGAMQSGGIVGYMGAYSSVKNCYSTGSVEAYNPIVPSTGFETYASAYAGGIAGYLEYDSVISNCFSLSETHASAQNSQYAFNGDITGGVSEGKDLIEAHAGVVLNCTAKQSDINQTYITQTLGWSTDDWAFTGTYPTVKVNNNEKPVNVTFYYDGKLGGSVTLESNAYITIYEWYDRGLDQFVDHEGLRSYGWYFDEKLTQRIPDSYIFTGSETLYCGLVNYNAVAGKYYLQTGVNGSGTYIELSNDGKVLYKEGARNLTSSFIYDGEKITLYGCPVFTEYNISYVTDANGNFVLDEDGNRQEIRTPYYSGGVATLENGRLLLVNDITYTQAEPRIALREMEGFVYGAYYSGTTDYVFYTDGTGRIGNRSITYTVNGSQISINDNGTPLTGTVTGGLVVSVGGTTLSKYDPFAGTWENKATILAAYTFDGKGNWSYEHYSYVNGEKFVFTADSASGTYQYHSDDNTLTLDNGVIVGFDAAGLLQVTNTNLKDSYYGEFSFVGKWRYFFANEAIEITFGGISKEGTGKAVLNYETLRADLEVTYHVLHDTTDNRDYIYIYNGDDLLGMLYFDPSDCTLRGMIYSYAEDEMVYAYHVTNADGEVVETYYAVRFCLYDEFYGEWLGENWGSVSFDGFGGYELAGLVIDRNIINTAVSGSVTINGERVQYKLENATMSGSLVFDGVTYTISYNEARDVIEIKSDTVPTFELVRPDSLYGLKLRSEDGTVYEFDGGSKHTNGGKLTYGKDTYYFYKVAEDGVITLYNSPNSVAGTITVKNGNYVLTIDAQTNITLMIDNEFTGVWNVGQSLLGMSIGEISASLTARGLYLGEAVTYYYDPADNVLSFEYKGETYYITSLVADNGTELRISDTMDEFGSSVYCVRNEKLDGYQGTYTASDGSYLVLDGLSTSSYAKGFAGIYFRSGVKITYSYAVNRFGMIELRNGNNYSVLVPSAADAKGAYVKGSTAYVITVPDIFYLVRAEDYFETEYWFDGLGKVTASNGKNYTYTVADQTEEDQLNLIYRMIFKEEDGTEHTVEFDYSTKDYVVKFTDELTDISIIETVISGITGNVTSETVYSFVCAGVLEVTETSYDRGGNILDVKVIVYSYTITGNDDDKKVYYLSLTASNGDGYAATVIFDTEHGTQITLTKVN